MKRVSFPKSQDRGENNASSTRTMPTMRRTYFSGLLLASVLGVISPKVRMTRVMTTVDTIDPVASPRRMANVRVAMVVAAMLTRLLPIRMVVRNLS